MRRYGEWAGNLKGFPEDKTRCIATVWHGCHSAQCSRPRGKGPDGLYCAVHGRKETERIERAEMRNKALGLR